MKEQKSSKSTFLWVGLLALGVGVVSDTVFRTRLFGLNASVLITLWVGICLVAASLHKAVSVKTIVYAFVALSCSVLIYLRSSGLVQFWLSAIALTMIYLLLAEITVINIGVQSLVNRPMALVEQFGKSAQTSPAKLRSALFGSELGAKRLSPGIVIAAVLGLVFILLFVSADQVLGKWFSQISSLLSMINRVIGPNLLGHIFWSGFWAIISFFIITMLLNRSNVKDMATAKLKTFLSLKDARIVLGTLVGIFSVFVAVQLRYLFVGGSLPSGMTYASYAHRGYGQLLIATLLASATVKFVLSSATAKLDLPKTSPPPEKLTSKSLVDVSESSASLGKSNKHGRTEKILSTVLIVLNAVVVLAAWKRLSLYEVTYGWTMLRFVARLGLISIGLGSVALIFWVYEKLSSKVLYVTGWYTVALVLMMAAILNPDGIIAQKNIVERSTRTTSLDTNYISSLSADSWPAICHYASTLKKDHFSEYTTLKNDQYSRNSEPNLGLSRSYTHTKNFVEKYERCLQ